MWMKGRTVDGSWDHSLHELTLPRLTCESAGLGQQEGAPGHEEEERRLQQREAVQFGELGDVATELKTTAAVFWSFTSHFPPTPRTPNF